MIINREQEFSVDPAVVIEHFRDEWESFEESIDYIAGYSGEDFIEYILDKYGLDEILDRSGITKDFETVRFV